MLSQGLGQGCARSAEEVPLLLAAHTSSTSSLPSSFLSPPKSELLSARRLPARVTVRRRPKLHAFLLFHSVSLSLPLPLRAIPSHLLVRTRK